MIVSLIWAMSKNRVIGAKNGLPWHLPEDLKWFRQKTQGKPVIMGRKTFESIGRPLPARENVIVTRQNDFKAPEGVKVAASIQDALKIFSSRSDLKSDAEIFIIGGGQIYEQAISQAQRLYMTVIDREIEGDTYFPQFNSSEFHEVYSEKHLDHEVPYSFFILEKN